MFPFGMAGVLQLTSTSSGAINATVTLRGGEGAIRMREELQNSIIATL